MKTLYGLSVEKLEIILENIRSNLNIGRNAKNFESMLYTLIKTGETICPRIGINI